MALLLLQKWAVQTSQTNKQKSSQRGLTLLEVLIGILIISVVVVASTPALILSVATRVQARRAEEAFNIAQQQAQQIELLVEQGDYKKEDLPSVASIINSQNASEASAPTKFCSSCQKYTEAKADELFKPNGKGKYLVQIFRSPGVSSNPNPLQAVPAAFNLGIRVYYESAQSQIGNLKTIRAPLTITSADGSIQKSPLAVLYLPVCQPIGTDAIASCNQLLTAP